MMIFNNLKLIISARLNIVRGSTRLGFIGRESSYFPKMKASFDIKMLGIIHITSILQVCTTYLFNLCV